MKIIAVFNSKGGVGKTASAVNLAYLSALDGVPTLLWDLDPQASSTFYYKVKTGLKKGAKALISGKHDLEEMSRNTDYDNLDLLPSDFSNRHLDVLIGEKKNAKHRLEIAFKHFSNYYDYVFIDAPPSFSLLSENIFYAADAILCPMIPTILSVRTYEQMTGYFEDHDIKKSKIIPFFSLVDSRKKLHRSTIEEYRDKKRFLNASVPYSTYVERMGEKQAPLFTFAPKSKPAIAYRELWGELKERLK